MAAPRELISDHQDCIEYDNPLLLQPDFFSAYQASRSTAEFPCRLGTDYLDQSDCFGRLNSSVGKEGNDNVSLHADIPDLLSKPPKLQIVVTSHRDTMPDVPRIDADQLVGPGISSVAALWSVALRAVRLVVVESEYAAPLLDGLVVVGRSQRRVRRAVVDLHLGPRALVAGVHIMNHLWQKRQNGEYRGKIMSTGVTCLRPHLRGAAGLAVGTRVVPLVGTAGLAEEATGSSARVDDARSKHLGVGSSHDVLFCTCNQQCIFILR